MWFRLSCQPSNLMHRKIRLFNIFSLSHILMLSPELLSKQATKSLNYSCHRVAECAMCDVQRIWVGGGTRRISVHRRQQAGAEIRLPYLEGGIETWSSVQNFLIKTANRK